MVQIIPKQSDLKYNLGYQLIMQLIRTWNLFPLFNFYTILIFHEARTTLDSVPTQGSSFAW